MDLQEKAKNDGFSTHLFKYVRDFFVSAGVVWGAIKQLIESGSIAGFDASWIAQLGALAIYAITIFSFMGGLLYASLMLLWRTKAWPASSEKHVISDKLSGGLENEIRKMYESKNYEEVVRFGSVVSRQLHLSGKYKERLAIGRMVEDSASKTGRVAEQVTALIDDLGWTNVLLRNYAQGERNIRHGLDVALDAKNFYLAAKAERHLAGIADWVKNDLGRAEEHLGNVELYVQKIKERKAKSEMFASLNFARGELKERMKEFDEALEFYTHAQKLFSKIPGQQERSVKIFSKIGGLYLKKENTSKAKDNFRRGLREAQRLARLDEQANNLLGLGETFLLEKDWPSAIQNLEHAQNLFEKLDLDDKAEKSRRLLSQAELGDSRAT